ncbi:MULTISPECIES: DUF934 domain-containing protein [Halomonas]|uniref:DUF934 domain-containing protein n=1 Tax=Halomonas chromatireducens TaxID=507626 RepID=A0A120JW21_9GAMM|nr:MULTISPECIES: DUF934 domain-containing protein [Halomonas]AMD00982.1 hypothetical protein LOKO_01914 [Halomonas chromatireducens]MBZ0330401.1 DUF934 domain-containing protein [Halomonas sp. ANAO-440]
MPDQATNARPFIFQGRPAEDRWTLIREPEAALPDGPAIVPLALWREQAGNQQRAPLLGSDTELTPELAAELADAPLIAIDFPKFTDGRGYSMARLLRERFGYAGEIRAVGDVLVDQVFFLTRCGFDALSLREDQWLEDALQALNAFSRAYQPAVDEPEPLFRHRLREAVREAEASMA